MAMLWKQVKIYKWACGWALNVDLDLLPYRYINFFGDTVYVKDYQIRLRASNYLKLLALLATTSEQLVSIPGKGNSVVINREYEHVWPNGQPSWACVISGH